MNRCSLCGISANVPGISLNEFGVCSLCQRGEGDDATDVVDYADAIQAELARSKGAGEYDAVACVSGGKDSTYALKVATQDYGLRVLAFTLDNGYLSDSALKNIHTVVDKLGVDHISIRPKKKVFTEIVKKSATQEIYNVQTLRRISSVCQSCITIVLNQAVTLALEKGAPVVIGGFTLGQVPRGKYGYELDVKQLNSMRRAVSDKLVQHGVDDAKDYMLINERLEECSNKTSLVNPLCAVEISESEIITEVERLGWSVPNDVDGCSTNCKLNTVGNHMHELRYGFNPYEIELSYLVRRGLMARDEMLSKIAARAETVKNKLLDELDLS